MCRRHSCIGIQIVWNACLMWCACITCFVAFVWRETSNKLRCKLSTLPSARNTKVIVIPVLHVLHVSIYYEPMHLPYLTSENLPLNYFLPCSLVLLPPIKCSSYKMYYIHNIHSVVVPPGELRVKAGVMLLAGKTVWSTPESLRDEVLTTRRYTKPLPLPYIRGSNYYALSLHGIPLDTFDVHRWNWQVLPRWFGSTFIGRIPRPWPARSRLENEL